MVRLMNDDDAQAIARLVAVAEQLEMAVSELRNMAIDLKNRNGTGPAKPDQGDDCT
jgi:hypothetical protein